MNPLTLEWVDKAEGDFTTALRELRARKSPNYDAACFHAQQCAEKYLKARLQEAVIAFSRTHNLTVLLDLLLPVEPGWDKLRTKLLALTAFSVAYRYPGASADKDTAREALNFCREVREQVRLSLGLTP
ncbi:MULTISPECIES: HEPN domain-containing protein [unclassified Microcoleus]|uniref:HEPN domain-containing protein n=1 Tax=unclassified Microcoleus TaxID=2642155 RepID=UPI002FD3C2E9